MRTRLLILPLALFPLPVAGQTLEPTDRGYIWRQGNEYVLFEKGKWFAGTAGKGEFSWHMFLWHGQWIYETLPGGKVDKQPAMQADGSLVMEGTISARDGLGAEPVQCAQRRSLRDATRLVHR